jgi:hypothetical protein
VTGYWVYLGSKDITERRPVRFEWSLHSGGDKIGSESELLLRGHLLPSIPVCHPIRMLQVGV